MWVFPQFISELAKTVLSYRVTADQKNDRKEGKLTTYCKAVSYLSEKYATEPVIVEAEAGIKASSSLRVSPPFASLRLFGRKHLDLIWYTINQG